MPVTKRFAMTLQIEVFDEAKLMATATAYLKTAIARDEYAMNPADALIALFAPDSGWKGTTEEAGVHIAAVDLKGPQANLRLVKTDTKPD